MSSRIEIYDYRKEPTSKWSKNRAFNVREAGVDIEKDYHGGEGTKDYNELSNKPQINGITLIGNKTTSDLGISADPLTEEQLTDLLDLLS